MSGPIQWLLIGGPGHGTTLWISQGDVLAWRGEQSVLYPGENHLYDGRLYRIGKHAPTADQCDEIDSLIQELQLRPIT